MSAAPHSKARTGRSIIGNTGLIKHLKHVAPKSQATGRYKMRNDRLPTIGYSTYGEYLKSPEWAAIRSRVLDTFPNCCCKGCPRKADQVHHWEYHETVLLGLNDFHLLPICDQCHGEAEFDGKRKRKLADVMTHLWPLLRENFRHRVEKGNAVRNTARKVMKKKAKIVKKVRGGGRVSPAQTEAYKARTANPIGQYLPDCLIPPPKPKK